jgi:hypothetical protein
MRRRQSRLRLNDDLLNGVTPIHIEPGFAGDPMPSEVRMTRRSLMTPFRRFPVWIALLVGIGFAVLTPRAGNEPSTFPVPSWHLQLSSSGTRTVRALVYGRNSGLHVIRVPASGAQGPLASLPPALADREVWLVSLGLSGLSVHGDAGTPAQTSFGAHGRLIKVYRDAHATGVRVW